MYKIQASIPHKKTTLLAALLSAFTLPAIAQQATPVDGAAAATETVVVTGTRARNRTVADSESPIYVLSNKDLGSTGSNELATVLSRLLPSFNFPRPSGGDASDAVRPAQLRGLSPDQTLVLINGKRRHTSARGQCERNRRTRFRSGRFERNSAVGNRSYRSIE